MVRYLLFYEDRLEDRAAIEVAASQYFEGYTIRAGNKGYWEGNPEDSTILEVLADYTDRANIYRLAEDIRQIASQVAVMVASYPVAVDIVTETTIDTLLADSRLPWEDIASHG